MKEFSFPFSMLILSGVFFVVGLVWGVNENVTIFSRFGSLVVLCGVASEYALIQAEFSKLYAALKGEGAAAAGNVGIPDLTPTKKHKMLALISHIVIITGTLIWGFGDCFLLFKLVCA